MIHNRRNINDKQRAGALVRVLRACVYLRVYLYVCVSEVGDDSRISFREETEGRLKAGPPCLSANLTA